MAQRYRTPPSHWLCPPDLPTRLDDPTERALWRLNLDLGIFLAGIQEDDRRRLMHELKLKHGF
jgi:hypothetical protein